MTDGTSFLDRLREPFATPAPPAPPRRQRDPFAASTPGGGSYAESAVNAELDALRAALPGERNHQLNRSSYSLGQLVEGGVLDHFEVADALTAVAREIGLDEAEIAPTIRSGLKSGAQTPRTIPDRQDTPPWLPTSPASSGGSSRPPSAGPSDTNPASRTTTLAAGQSVNGATNGSTGGESPPERTSWYFRDLEPAIAGREVEPPPVALHREDDAALFYAGKVNGLIGESESGKTWVGLLAVKQTLARRERVLYLDFEDSPGGIIGRLRAMGATDGDLAMFAYIDPDEALGIAQRADLGAAVQEHRASLIIVDGVNAAMTLLGLDISDNNDATAFSQKLLKPLAASRGAAVVYIDHIPKSPEGRGKGGIGAQAKRAMTTGCALRVDVITEFGRGMTGKLKLTVDKDRAGHVRAVSRAAKHAGLAVLVSNAQTGHVAVTIQAPEMLAEGEVWKPTALMLKVSQWLETQPEGVTGSAVEAAIDGKHAFVREALKALVADGFVTVEQHGKAHIHTLINPYTAL